MTIIENHRKTPNFFFKIKSGFEKLNENHVHDINGEIVKTVLVMW